MKKQTKIAIIVLVVLLIAAVALVIILRPETDDGMKSISFIITGEDGASETFTIETDKEYLADALLDEGLIEESEYETGFYTIIDGEVADWDDNQSWWCIMQDGEMAQVGMNEIALVDGGVYEAIYTQG